MGLGGIDATGIRTAGLETDWIRHAAEAASHAMADGSPRHRADRTAGAGRTPLTSPGTRPLDASPLSPFAHVRLGVVMRADLQAPHEVWGVLNPAVARGRDGELYLFPRVVAAGNYSRIGIARVRFDAAGLPMGVEWLGYALEPEQPYEKNPKTGGGVEDPRITFIDPLDCYVMAYTAYGPEGPRVALAVSHDFFDWRRLGPAGGRAGRYRRADCSPKTHLFRRSGTALGAVEDRRRPGAGADAARLAPRVPRGAGGGCRRGGAPGPCALQRGGYGPRPMGSQNGPLSLAESGVAARIKR